ncbi:MAG: hypothetical protein Q9226_006290 [Calogaya cf. arnoldii]
MSSAVTTISIDQSMTETLVLLAVRLKDTEHTPNLLSWQNWCHDLAPNDIESVHALRRIKIRDLIKLEAQFLSNSSLLLISLPIFIWDRLPKSPAYSFVGFIKSANLVFPSWNPQLEVDLNSSTYNEDWTRVKTIEDQSEFDWNHLGGDEKNGQLRSKTALAKGYEKQGLWGESEKLFKEVVFARQSALGHEHPDTLISMANLASMYRNQGRWKEAEELQVLVMETTKRTLGEEHPGTLTSIANLASIYSNQGRWTEGEKLQVQVIETRKRVLGEEHPDTLTSIANLASTYSNQGRWMEGEKLQVQVIETRKKVLGLEYPDTLTSMANLASIYWNQGRWIEAEKLQVQVIATRKRVLGIEHPSTLTTMNNLALVLERQGKYEQAASMFRQTLATRKKVLGLEHPSTLTTMNNLALVLERQGNYEEAESMYSTIAAMPPPRIVQDSDEEDNADASPIRQAKRVPEVPSSPAGTGSTERLNRDIENAHISLLEPSTSSRSSLPSSDSASNPKKRVANGHEEKVSKKPKITYGERKSQDNVAFASDSEDGGPVRHRKRAQSTANTLLSDINRCGKGDGDHVTTSTNDTSMPPPLSKSSGATQQDVQSSFASTTQNTDRPSSPIVAISRIRKRALSEMESPKIILGDEVAPSSSAPASSPVKRARTSRPQEDLDGGHDELSLSVTDIPVGSKKKTKPIAGSSSAKFSAMNEPNIGDSIPDMPTENYEPRPSRSRSGLAADDVVIPTDFLKRPESIAKKKAKSKRQKVAAPEEANPSARASPRRRQTKPASESDLVDLEKAPGNTAIEERTGVEIEVIESHADSGAPIKSPTREKPPTKKSRGRPKKGVAVEESERPSASESIHVDKGDDQEVPAIATSAPAPIPAKRGRKRKEPTAEKSSAFVHEDPPSGDEHKESVIATNGILSDADPNIRPISEISATHGTEVPETPKPESHTPSSVVKPMNASESPSKQAAVKTEKKLSGAGKDSPAAYRVGLSKRQRIAPLLRIVKK